MHFHFLWAYYLGVPTPTVSPMWDKAEFVSLWEFPAMNPCVYLIEYTWNSLICAVFLNFQGCLWLYKEKLLRHKFHTSQPLDWKPWRLSAVFCWYFTSPLASTLLTFDLIRNMWTTNGTIIISRQLKFRNSLDIRICISFLPLVLEFPYLRTFLVLNNH